MNKSGMLLPLALFALTGCGGGAAEEEDPCGGVVVAVVTAGFSCLGGGSSSSSTPPPPATTPPPSTPVEPPPPPRTVVMNDFEEYEPNSTFDNANPVNFLDGDPDQSIGIEILGNVKQDDDGADYFIFTPTRSETFLIYLCGDTCVDHPVTDEVYIAVYDQSQTTIASTPIGTESEQFVRANLTAGLAYYVEINGYNTGAAAYDYKLVVID